jgi:hypothetical protein
VPQAGDFAALPIVSATGAGDPAGDIIFNDTLGAMGKTLGMALGVSPDALDMNIMTGKPVLSALA